MGKPRGATLIAGECSTRSQPAATLHCSPGGTSVSPVGSIPANRGKAPVVCLPATLSVCFRNRRLVLRTAINVSPVRSDFASLIAFQGEPYLGLSVRGACLS